MKERKTIIRAVENLVQNKFKNEGTGHDWYHINRVRNLALKIQEAEGGDVYLIELAALLHDISDHKFNGGDFEKGADVSREILNALKVEEEVIDKVSHIVKNISFKGSGEKDLMDNLEGKIVQDADRLDAIGAIGIARTFAYGGSVNQAIYDPEIPPKTNQSKESYVKERSHTINHFYEKLLLLKDRMHTSTAKGIAQERNEFMSKFLEEFYMEWNG